MKHMLLSLGSKYGGMYGMKTQHLPDSRTELYRVSQEIHFFKTCYYQNQ
jgi:hypothetical protein